MVYSQILRAQEVRLRKKIMLSRPAFKEWQKTNPSPMMVQNWLKTNGSDKPDCIEKLCKICAWTTSHYNLPFVKDNICIIY